MNAVAIQAQAGETSKTGIPLDETSLPKQRWAAQLGTPESVQAGTVDSLPFPPGNGEADAGIQLHRGFGDCGHVVQGDEIGAMETEEAVWKTVLPGLDALPALQVSLGGVEHGGVTKALQIENLCQRYPAAGGLRLPPGLPDSAGTGGRKQGPGSDPALLGAPVS